MNESWSVILIVVFSALTHRYGAKKDYERGTHHTWCCLSSLIRHSHSWSLSLCMLHIIKHNGHYHAWCLHYARCQLSCMTMHDGWSMPTQFKPKTLSRNCFQCKPFYPQSPGIHLTSASYGTYDEWDRTSYHSSNADLANVKDPFIPQLCCAEK